jgi:hypothetical protein
MKNIFTILLLAASGLSLNAQCPGGRYLDSIFTGTPIVTSNITYGNNLRHNNASQNLLMDVYEPDGDIATDRALVILVHGGSFIGGDKTADDVLPMSYALAKMGYVVASINYRLGMKNFPSPGPDSTDATEAVMRAVQDARAAVRYFRKDFVTNGNSFGIDTSNIYMVGVSAGGFVALQSAYMDMMSEFPTYIDTTGEPGLHGGLEGLSGNPGYSSEVKAIVNICGAIGDTTWMQPGDEPLLSFHGTNDGTVPYATDVITLLGFYPLLQVHGSYTVSQRANEIGLTSCFEIYEGQDHVPHMNQPAYYDTTLTMTKDFLAHFICGSPINCTNPAPIPVASIMENVQASDIPVYPNPAEQSFTIDLSVFGNEPAQLQLLDLSGRLVSSRNESSAMVEFQRAGLESGMYFLNITIQGRTFTRKIVLN